MQGTCTRSPCEYWHPPECQFYESESGCKAGEKCLFPHYKVEEQPSKKPKKSFQNGKSDDKGAVAVVKTVPQLGCVSQGSEPSALPNSVKYRGNPRWKVLGSIRQVRFTQSTLREANIRENKGPSLEKIQVKIPYQRSPCAKKFEYRSQEETERQMRCGRGMAWSLARHICKLKEKDKATSYSPTDKWIMPAARVCGRFRSKYAFGQQDRP